jgi:hypothetical protein
MAKDVLTNVSEVHDKNVVNDYIQQIKAGGTTYDIATHHSITFFDGQGDQNPIKWNGITDLQVVIPKISDLVTNPIRLVGTVNAVNGEGKITYTDGRGETDPNKIGDLVYMAADCTFNGQPCEAGDMAVYAGQPKDGDTGTSSGWVIVSGENQVTINGIGKDGTSTFSISSTPQNVLTVEGKKLLLNLDYGDIYDKFSAEKNVKQELTTTGTVTVNGVYVGLTQASGTSLDISKAVSFNNATAVASDAVSINEKVLTADNFVWNSGTLPTLKKEEVTVNISDGRRITKGADSSTGMFVTNIDASVVKSAVLNTDTGLDGGKPYIASASTTTSGTQLFVSGVHTKTSDDKGTADFTVMTYGVDASANTFVSGLSAESETSGDLLASVAVGKVSLVEGSGILTGISSATNGAIVTGVSFGSVASNADEWFVRGVNTNGSDVVTNVTAISAATLVEDGSTSLRTSAMVSAEVSNHVLSFTVGDVMKPVSVSTSAAVVTKGGFVKGGVSLTGQSVSKANFTQSALKQEDSKFTYKNVLTGNVTMTSSSVEYFFDKKNETVPTYTSSTMKLDVAFANVSKADPTIDGTLTASIPSNTVVTAFASAGQLPSLSVKEATGTLTGKLNSTALATENVSFLGVDEDKMKKTQLAGAYSLVSASTSSDGYIGVATSGNYQLDGGIAIVPPNTFIADVYVSSSKLNLKVPDTPLDVL